MINIRRTIKVEAKFEGCIPTASYANSRPGFMASEEFVLDCPKEEIDIVIADRQRELHLICFSQFQMAAEAAKFEKVQADLKNFRFYEEGGDKFPSVTSFLNYDKDFWCSDEDLKQYAAQGNLIDWEVRNFVETGKYVDSKDEPSLAADRWIIKSGKLQLALSGWDFRGFLAKYPIKNLKSCKEPIFNHQFRYAGTPDLVGEYNDLPTLVSIKRTKNETDNFIQDSCYAKCKGMENIKQIIVVPLKSEQDGGNAQGFSKPSVTTDIDRYFEIAKYKRNEFKKIYGI